MLSNIERAENLRGLARTKSRNYVTKTVPLKLEADSQAEGWVVDKRNMSSVRLKKAKSPGVLLEDRVWMLLYRMGFVHISGGGGAILTLQTGKAESPKNQIDILALDPEVAIAIECKSSVVQAKRPQFPEELAKHAHIRETLTASIKAAFPTQQKRQLALAMFTSNITLTSNDLQRAKLTNVALFDNDSLAYYEALVSHLGPAARYQFLSDLLPGKEIPGLRIRIPAIRTKMGGTPCYTFSISPSYLLKISYVSHRSKGKASDVDTYQRMISKSRLIKIKDYINNNGIFPTNIVLNLAKRRLAFERIHQESTEEGEQDSGTLGWLDIRPSYKSAWIIDGQHRLFAYSGLEKADKSKLSVLAFEGLSPGKQAQLFIDINSEQKSVKQSLLQELYAELHWDADDPASRVRAVISKAILRLSEDPESALHRRIQTADATREPIRCITLQGLFEALAKTDFHIVSLKKGRGPEFGPLWADDTTITLTRTVAVLKDWFNVIRARTIEWWDKGAGEGGGLAMNDGVITCINILRSVFQHLDQKGQKLIRLDDEDLSAAIRPYAEALGDYLGAMSEEERKQFRDLRGNQGQTTRTRRCQKAIQQNFPSFCPEGLEEFLQQEKAQTNVKAKDIIDRIERTLQRVVLEELRKQHGPDESQWWMLGVPKTVRNKVAVRYEEEDGKRGGKEYYFDLIDYRNIALDNWAMFDKLLGYGKGGGKEKRTHWMQVVNERRKVVSHASSAVSITIDELQELQKWDSWFQEHVIGQRDADVAYAAV